jgi:hypothetical protein
MRTRRSERPRATPPVKVRRLSPDEVAARDLVAKSVPDGRHRRVNYTPDLTIERVKYLVNKYAREQGMETHWGYLRSDGHLVVAFTRLDAEVIEIDF